MRIETRFRYNICSMQFYLVADFFFLAIVLMSLTHSAFRSKSSHTMSDRIHVRCIPNLKQVNKFCHYTNEK